MVPGDVRVVVGETEIDAFVWTSAVGSGQSLQVDPDFETATANDEQRVWCDGAADYGAGDPPDRGTPGTANADCEIAPPDGYCVGDGGVERLIVSPTNSKTRLIEHIASAKTSLDVEVMYVSETSIRDAIIAAKNRGVTVRVIINESTDPAVASFKTAGIPVKTPSSFYLHAKLITADDVAFVGSENMSFTSLTKNREVGALVFEPSAFAPIKQQFDADWNSSTVVP